MKKVAILLVVLMSLYTVSGAVMAKDAKSTTAKAAMEMVKGKIVSIDTKLNAIVVKDLKSNTDKSITVDSKIISTLKVGQEVKISLKADSNVADSVKVIPVK